MSKLSRIFSFSIPIIFSIGGILTGFFAVQELKKATDSLQCFCPSCPETAFEAAGINMLGTITVEIAGAVQMPGIYQLKIGQRIADLIGLANGFDKKVDKTYLAQELNLSTPLKDAQKIYIPFEGEMKPSSLKEDGSTPSTSLESSSACTSVNKAGQSELEDLPGIGEKRASDIISNRPYSNLNELIDKKILTDSLWQQIQSLICL